MEKKQKINCCVESCMHNDAVKEKCMLEEISVEPCCNCHTEDKDESMCGNYECRCNGDKNE